MQSPLPPPPPNSFATIYKSKSNGLNMRNLALLFLLVAYFAAPQAQAQNPTAAPCGLPAAGTIFTSVTYTLIDDCTQTGALNQEVQPPGQPGITLTIDGDGHTIKLGEGTWLFAAAREARNAIVLRNVTIDGQLNKRPVNLQGSISAENVIFTKMSGIVIHAAPAASLTLTNVLFDSNLIGGLGFGVNGGTLNIPAGASATVTNAVFRNNRDMNIVMHSGGSLTTEGCLSFSGNLPYNVVHSGIWSGAGAWTDNSTGECSGEKIINGHPVAIPPVTLLPCGLPSSLALIDTDVTFTLRADCEGIIGLVVSEGVQATIRGNGYRISRNGSLPAVFRVAGDASLTISDAIFDMGQFVNYGGTLTVSHSEVRNSANRALINYGTANFSNMLFQDNSAPSFAGLYYGGAIFLKGIGTFSDSRFVNVSGGSAALVANRSTAALNLNGCIIFEGLAQGYPETLVQNGAALNDNRDSAACNPTVGPRPPESPGERDKDDSSSYTFLPPADICDGIPGAVPLGAIACLFRDEGSLTVYEVDEESRGHFRLRATQAQVEANGVGMIAASPDGLAAVYKMEDGNVMVAVGPDAEGKFVHVTLDDGVNGRVLGQSNSYGQAPGLAGSAQAAARTGPVQNCMVTTTEIVNFREAPGGGLVIADWIPNSWLPRNATLTALERTSDWFKVDYYGLQGWISADYVTTRGDCG